MKTAGGVGFPSDAAGGGRTVGAQLSSYTHVASVAQFVRTPAHRVPRTSAAYRPVASEQLGHRLAPADVHDPASAC